MMQKIEQLCIVISILSVSGSVITALLTDNSLKKSLKIIVCVIILYSIINSFSGIKKDDFNFTIDDSIVKESVNDESMEMVVNEAKTMVDSAVENKLKENGINVRCNSIINCEGDELYIDSIYVEGKLNEREKEIVSNLLNEIKNDKTEIRIKVIE